MDREEVKEKVYSILNSSGFGNIIDENYYHFFYGSVSNILIVNK